jgi:UDP-N-acetylglucosamine 4,6-dehydratase
MPGRVFPVAAQTREARRTRKRSRRVNPILRRRGFPAVWYSVQTSAKTTPMKAFADPSVSFDGQSILVTGGTGSFGKRLISTLLHQHSPRRVIIFSRDELKQYEMQQELNPEDHPCLRYFIGDVRDRDRLAMAMREVDVVVHAAALKHVPAAEYNPTECVRTNINGAENVVACALNTGVKKVIALSTDKAVSPANLYGATKLASDKIFVAANNLAGKRKTMFSVVRYGNVVGSRGSVVPLFERMVKQGVSELPITDERMTRFWITLQQGVDFSISCYGMMRGGEIFVPKLPSMKVTDVAKTIGPGLPHKHIGIRPGEKLHECMITRDDSLYTYDLGDRYIIEPSFQFTSRAPVTEWFEGKKDIHLVESGFQYSSDTNTEWLDNGKLEELLGAQR